MDFDAMLEQVLALVQQQRRVSYRAIKRRFEVEDDFLEDLKEEILFAHPHIVDEEGRGFVWTDPETVPPVPSDSDEDPLPSAPETPVRVPISEAERRQLTVMFCDLVGSTALSGQLDPEDLREVVRAYQERAADVIQRYDGHIAQYLGDGLLVYFGWPQAHEDDAHRAVHSGLGIVEAVDALNTTLETAYGVQLAVRLGIHTGSVVVGEIGSGDRHENLALGETPNIAARLEGLAQPGSVVISNDTRHLVAGAFDYDELGAPELKGVSESIPVFRVRGLSSAVSRFEATTTTLTPMVGREVEVDLLMRCWEQVLEGDGQVVLLNGPPGIGKSRLLQALCAQLADVPHVRLRYQCSPYHTNSAFYPIATQVTRAMQLPPDPPSGAKLEQLEALVAQTGLPLEETVTLFAAMLSVPTDDRYPALGLSPQRQKDRTLELFAQGLVNFSRQEPVLVLFEDVHWADPTSLEALSRVIDQVQDARVLVVLTYRPEFEPPWSGSSHVTTYTLTRLSRRQTATLIEQVTGGKGLPAEVREQVVAKTDGIPLFVEELTKHVLESGWLVDNGVSYALTVPLPPLAIPTTLHDSLMARLDRLAAVKGLAQLGATLGREFSYELLQAVAPWDEATLRQGLHQLVEAEFLYQRGLPPLATYVFKHALLQETAYQSLLRSTRQQHHQHIAQVVAQRFPELCAMQPEVLAHHYTEAGLAEEAVAYWQQAGEHSNKRSAYVEAVAHCTRGLEVLRTLPDTPTRVQQELALQLLLSEALIGAKGHGAPEREPVLARARELCRQAGDTARLFTVLVGLSEWYVNQGAFQTARALDAECLSMAQRQPDPMLRLRAHAQLAVSAYFLGELVPAHAHLEQAMALSLPHHSRTPQPLARVLRLGYAALTLWMLGYPEQALTRSQEMLTNVQEPSHAFSLARALYYAAWLHGLRREVHATQERAEASLALSTAQGFAPWIGPGTFWRGWALAAQGQYEAGIAQMHQGLAIKCATGSVSILSTYLGGLAEGYGGSGQAQEGLSLLAEALAHVGTTGERYWEAELHRLRGALLLQQAMPDAHNAESCFQHALAVAHDQQAKSLELRAATSLARLWQRQDKRQKAYALLAPVYNWFTEGFDTADLQQAKALLEELS